MAGPGGVPGDPQPGDPQPGAHTALPPDAWATTIGPAVTPAGGIPTVSPSPDEVAAIAGLPAGSAMLVAHRGAQAGARFLLDADVTTAGRDVAADILLDDRTVSRKHVEIHRTDAGFVVRDCGSLNGTYVNGARVDEVVLAAGDELRVGKFRLTFHPSPAAQRR